jgi:hypothetical protein
MRTHQRVSSALIISSLCIAAACGDDDNPVTPATEPPAAITGGASAISEVSAQLSGTVDAFGSAGTYWFEYGVDPDYGSTTPETTFEPCSCGEQPVSAELQELTPSTQYHYRLVARNAAGTAHGEDQTLVTRIRNQPPETQLITAPPDTVAGVVSWPLYWTGRDVDGAIRGFELRAVDHGPDGTLDIADSLGVPWHFTSITDSVLTWPDGVGARTVFVRAIDLLDARDPSPAEQSVFPAQSGPNLSGQGAEHSRTDIPSPTGR